MADFDETDVLENESSTLFLVPRSLCPSKAAFATYLAWDVGGPVYSLKDILKRINRRWTRWCSDKGCEDLSKLGPEHWHMARREHHESFGVWAYDMYKVTK